MYIHTYTYTYIYTSACVRAGARARVSLPLPPSPSLPTLSPSHFSLFGEDQRALCPSLHPAPLLENSMSTRVVASKENKSGLERVPSDPLSFWVRGGTKTPRR